MEDRRHQSGFEGRAFGPETPERALEALRALPDPPDGLDDSLLHRPYALIEILLDHVDRFEWQKALALITCAAIEELDVLAAEHLLKERLLLDPVKLAEDTVVRLWTDLSGGQRKRPFETWARDAIRRSTRWCRDRGDIPAIPQSAKTESERRLMSHAMNVANHLEFDARRIAWHAWVDHLSPEQIQHLTNVPVERVEWMLQSILERAWQAMKGADSPDQRAFGWKQFLLEKEQEDESNRQEEEGRGEEAGDG